MCDFPSWIHKDGKDYWLTDKDIEGNILDGCGHSAIEAKFNIRNGEHKEWPIYTDVPEEFLKAIRDGKCRKMLATKWKAWTLEYTEELDGTKIWYSNGKRHRDDGPAIEDAYGNKYWFRNDLLHRDDGPAIEYTNGYKVWYRNGIFIKGEESK